MAKVSILIYRDDDVQDGNKVRVFANREEALNVFKLLIAPIDDDDELDGTEVVALAAYLDQNDSVCVNDEYYYLLDKTVE